MFWFVFCSSIRAFSNFFKVKLLCIHPLGLSFSKSKLLRSLTPVKDFGMHAVFKVPICPTCFVDLGVFFRVLILNC